MSRFYVYLAFQYNTEAVPPGFTHVLLRTLRGPMTHVEIALADDRGEMWRVIAAQPSAERGNARTVFRTQAPYHDTRERSWKFLRLLCTREQVAQINAALRAHERDYFSFAAMYQAGSPWLPRCLWSLFVDDPPPAAGEAEPTFCAKLCVQALQQAGFLPSQPADLTTAGDLWVLANAQLPVVETDELMRRVSFVDALGLPLSSESVMNRA